MNKRVGVGVVAAFLLLVGAMSANNSSQSSDFDNAHINSATPAVKRSTEKIKPTCDGTVTTTNCTLDGTSYKTYIYHPAVVEKSHTETVTTYKEEVTGYCTLCNDGTYSPSCATGRGACSYHDGVAQWNAPISTNVPIVSTKTVIDVPAQEAYYEKVAE